MTLTQAEQQSIGLTYAKLAIDVKQSILDCFCPGENIVDDDLSISVIVNDKSRFLCKCFPLAVNVVYEVDKKCGTICWAKGHHTVRPFDSIGALEGQLLLADKLVIPHGGIKEPI